MDSQKTLWALAEPKVSDFYNTLYNMDSFLLLMDILIGVFALLLIAELSYDILKGKRRGLRDFAEPFVNISFHIGSVLVELSILSVVLGFGLVFFSLFAITEIPLNAVSWIACFVLMDFIYYWMHRWDHKIRLLWTMHSVHHSSEEYDFTTAIRLFWFISLTQWFFYLPLVIAGFNPMQIFICMAIQPFYGFWLHTEKIGKLPIIDKVLNTPSFHRVHHGTNRQYIDKNFAGIFVIWDKLFGTYEPEVEKVNYGLTKPVNSKNPIKVGVFEFIELGKALKNADTWGDRLKHLYKGPGWQPNKKYL